MVTSSADSIWRRFAPSAPHRRARRWLSTGSILTSTALLAIQQFAAQRMGNHRSDTHLREGLDERLRAREVHDPVVARSASQFGLTSLGETLYENPLRGAHHG